MIASTNTNFAIDTNFTRTFLPENLQFSDWSEVEKYFNELLSRAIHSASDLELWLKNRSELEAFLQEDFGWRYIRMSCDTSNEELSKSFNFFVNEIQPKISPLSNSLDKKLIDSPFAKDLKDDSMKIVLRQIRKRIEIFREVNIPLFAELQSKEQEYSAIMGALTIEVDGKELTLQQANNYLERDDRDLRESVYRKIAAKRLSVKEQLDTLFDQLLALRNQIASNAGYSNFRDYMFDSLGRFDYTAEDCFRFHDAIASEVVPLLKDIETKQQHLLGLSNLRPWDLQAVPNGIQPLRPSQDATDLMNKTVMCFEELNPFLGACMRAMVDTKRLDLDSRKGKAPGGYNYPLYETGLPFIFMNSTNSLRDLVTVVHEGGHAVHSIVNKQLALVDYKNLPSEVAELASMSMELISMEHWNHFFTTDADLKRAKIKQLEDVLKGLPWIAAVDAFQHWIYLNPNHTHEERSAAWMTTIQKFSGNLVDWSGLEENRSNQWHNQLHIFEVPFYYIEYGFAQLGAIAVWKNFKANNQLAIDQYLAALSLGYTRSIGDIYKTAGIQFNFSVEYVKQLCDFVRTELENLK